jgi:hypothetical protein
MSLASISRIRTRSCRRFCLVACIDLFRLDTDFVWLVALKRVLEKDAQIILQILHNMNGLVLLKKNLRNTNMKLVWWFNLLIRRYNKKHPKKMSRIPCRCMGLAARSLHPVVRLPRASLRSLVGHPFCICWAGIRREMNQTNPALKIRGYSFSTHATN